MLPDSFELLHNISCAMSGPPSATSPDQAAQDTDFEVILTDWPKYVYHQREFIIHHPDQ